MNIKCPNCGAVHSLDSLINDTDASAVLKAVLDMDAELGKPSSCLPRMKTKSNTGHLKIWIGMKLNPMPCGCSTGRWITEMAG